MSDLSDSLQVRRFSRKPQEILAIKMPEKNEFPLPQQVIDFIDSIGLPWKVYEIPGGYACVTIGLKPPGSTFTVHAGRWLYKVDHPQKGESPHYGHCGLSTFEDYDLLDCDESSMAKWQAKIDEEKRQQLERHRIREDYDWDDYDE